MPAVPPDDFMEHIAFATSNAKQLLQYMRANGIRAPKTLSVHRDGSKFFFVHDPEGNKIEFVETVPTVMPAPHEEPVSTHIIHAGFVVRDGKAEDDFYKRVLGFHLYWHSLPHSDGSVDFVAMQVPDGTDWLEYMQNAPNDRSRKRLTSADHFSPGVVSVEQARTILEARGWQPSASSPMRLGHDGKWQQNLRDPAGTRVEIMQFQPTATPSVPFTGPQPGPASR
jgi:catechol 2,3-dioxygenase-like lactoylglutathione lyase family enzyme